MHSMYVIQLLMQERETENIVLKLLSILCNDSYNLRIIILLMYVFCITVPTPSININILNIQTVGQSLTLESTVTTVRGITSRMDIVWSSNGLMLKLTEGINHSSTSNNSVIYTDIYTIPQLNTSDEGRNIQCDTFINTVSTVTASDSVTLNVIGK